MDYFLLRHNLLDLVLEAIIILDELLLVERILVADDLIVRNFKEVGFIETIAVVETLLVIVIEAVCNFIIILVLVKAINLRLMAFLVGLVFHLWLYWLLLVMYFVILS